MRVKFKLLLTSLRKYFYQSNTDTTILKSTFPLGLVITSMYVSLYAVYAFDGLLQPSTGQSATLYVLLTDW